MNKQVEKQDKKTSSSSASLAALLLKLNELTGGVDAEASDDAWIETLVVTSDEPLLLVDQ